jgi:hypothetical protein
LLFLLRLRLIRVDYIYINFFGSVVSLILAQKVANTAWHDKMVWSKFYKDDYKEIAKYLAETYNEVTSILNSCLYKVFPKIKEIKKKTSFRFIIPEDANYSDPHVSGDGRYFSFTEKPNISRVPR